MYIKKENYREFELNRLVWGTETATTITDAPTTTIATAEAPTPEENIKQHRDTTESLINSLLKNAPSADNALHKELINHAKQKFDKIEAEYINNKEKEDYNGSAQIKESEDLLSDIKNRVNEHVETSKTTKDSLTKVIINSIDSEIHGLKSGDTKFQSALNIFLTSLSEDRIKEISSAKTTENMKISDKEKNNMYEAFAKAYNFGNLEKADEKEMELIGELEINDQPLSTLSPDTVKILSMTHEFKEVDGDLKIKVGNDFKAVAADGLAEYLPASMRKSYKTALNNDPFNKNNFNELANGELKTRESMEQLEEILANPETAKKMGIMEMLGSLGQLLKLFQEAFKTGDWQSLNDAVKDFGKGRNPAERVKEAEKTYSDRIKNINSTNELVELYKDPYGDTAIKEFGEGDEATPYRVQLKEAIQAKLSAELGIEIESMEVTKAGVVEMVTYKDENTIHIFLENNDGETLLTVGKTGLREDKTQYVKRSAKAKVENLTGGDNSLSKKIPTLFDSIQIEPVVAEATTATTGEGEEGGGGKAKKDKKA